jgi:hypothetical protein
MQFINVQTKTFIVGSRDISRKIEIPEIVSFSMLLHLLTALQRLRAFIYNLTHFGKPAI